MSDGRRGETDPERFVALGEAVVDALVAKGIDALVIGGFAVVAHADVRELLIRNPDANREEIRALCRGYRLNLAGLL